MDLLPITDLAQSAQIAHYGELANDKLKEAQGIIQSGLDVHMLLSHYDFYKQFTQNVGDTVSDIANDIKSNILPSGGDSSFDPTELWNYGQQQLAKANQFIGKVKQAKKTIDDTIADGTSKYEELKNTATNQYNVAKEEFNTGVNTVKSKVGDTIKTVEQKGNEFKDELNNTAKKINDDVDQELENTKNQFTNAPKTLEEQLSSMTMSDPAESATSQILTSEELGRVGMLKNPVLNDYYARKVFPDDIFADEPSASNITIAPYKVANKIKKVSKLGKKMKQQKPKEEEDKPVEQETPEQPALSPQGQDALFPMREMMAKRALPTEEAPAEAPAETPNADIENMSEEDLISEISNMAGGARSPMAEERFQQLNQKLAQITKNKPVETNEPKINTLEEDTTASEPQTLNNITNEGEELLNTTKSGVAKIPQAIVDQTQQLSRTGNELSQELQDNISDATEQMRTFTTNLSSNVNNVIKGATDDVEGTINKVKNSLLGDTEESIAGDEDPVGLAITVGLGLADLGTQIASFFDKPKTPTIAIQSQQVGV